MVIEYIASDQTFGWKCQGDLISNAKKRGSYWNRLSFCGSGADQPTCKARLELYSLIKS